MVNLKLKCAFELIERYKEPDDYIAGPKTDEQIILMEDILNVSLPPSYKEFIKKYGSGGVKSIDFLGITKTVEGSESVTSTLDNRKYGLPLEYVIVTNDGDGSYCAIDCSTKNTEGESPVIRWASFFKPEKIAEDFGEFMLADLENILEISKS
jgi:hypothetical protein